MIFTDLFNNLGIKEAKLKKTGNFTDQLFNMIHSLYYHLCLGSCHPS